MSRLTEWGMNKSWRQRIVLALVIVAVIHLFYTVVYWWAMATIEGRPITFIQSLQQVVEAITTAGFGGFSPWETRTLNVLIMAMNLTGVLLVFLALPAFAVPLFREVAERSIPKQTDLTDHVVICAYSRIDEVLREELEAVDVPYVFVEENPELVLDLNDRNINAIRGDPERIDALQNANVSEARAVVADLSDETNPTIALSAKRINDDVTVISVISNYETEPYQRYAGADKVVQARQLLGDGLAMRAAETLAEDFREAIDIETELDVTEILVHEDSELVGTTLRDATIFDRMGVTVVGGWFGGKLIVPPDPTTTIEENTILLCAGEIEETELTQLKSRPLPAHEQESSRVVVCGYGTVGWNAVRALENEGLDVTVVDLEPKDGVDVVGDVTTRETLRKANVADARTIVLTLNDDTTSIYAALMLEQHAPDVEIIARANDPDNVWKLYGAGADFVLSLSSVTGEILASMLIEEQEIVTAQTEFEFVRARPAGLAEMSLAEIDLRAKTGCTVVAVERADTLLTDLRGDFVIEEGDVLIVAGSEESIRHVSELLPVTNPG